MNARAAEIGKRKGPSPKAAERDKNESIKIDQTEEEPNKVEQVIYLKDFPQSAQDLQMLLNFGLDRIHGIYLIEELFSREFDVEEEEGQE